MGRRSRRTGHQHRLPGRRGRRGHSLKSCSSWLLLFCSSSCCCCCCCCRWHGAEDARRRGLLLLLLFLSRSVPVAARLPSPSVLVAARLPLVHVEAGDVRLLLLLLVLVVVALDNSDLIEDEVEPEGDVPRDP
jgi:hypothetical protein